MAGITTGKCCVGDAVVADDTLGILDAAVAHKQECASKILASRSAPVYERPKTAVELSP
jgi:hypothetical protein